MQKIRDKSSHARSPRCQTYLNSLFKYVWHRGDRATSFLNKNPQNFLPEQESHAFLAQVGASLEEKKTVASQVSSPQLKRLLLAQIAELQQELEAARAQRNCQALDELANANDELPSTGGEKFLSISGPAQTAPRVPLRRLLAMVRAGTVHSTSKSSGVNPMRFPSLRTVAGTVLALVTATNAEGVGAYNGTFTPATLPPATSQAFGWIRELPPFEKQSWMLEAETYADEIEDLEHVAAAEDSIVGAWDDSALLNSLREQHDVTRGCFVSLENGIRDLKDSSESGAEAVAADLEAQTQDLHSQLAPVSRFLAVPTLHAFSDVVARYPGSCTEAGCSVDFSPTITFEGLSSDLAIIGPARADFSTGFHEAQTTMANVLPGLFAVMAAAMTAQNPLILSGGNGWELVSSVGVHSDLLVPAQRAWQTIGSGGTGQEVGTSAFQYDSVGE